MTASFPRSGVGAAMITLFREDGGIDAPAMARLGRWLLANGCDFLLLFGTTGEGPSLAVGERAAALRGMIDEGLPAERIVAGTGCAALSDTIALTAAVGDLGCAGALVIPPFFFRQASRDGLASFLDALLIRTHGAGTPIALYHFPEMSGVSYDDEMIAKALRDHPGRIVGIKNSTGDKDQVVHWATMFPDVAVYAGDDHLIRPLIAAGGAGPMTATAGLAPALVADVAAAARRTPTAAPVREDRLNRLWREVLLTAPVTEAVKLLFAHITGDERWLRMRAPLRPLDQAAAKSVTAGFDAVDDGSVAAAVRAMPPVFT